MPAGIGGGGSIGIALEAVAGTYLAPTKFVPVRSESLKFMQEINYTRPIINVAVDPVFAVKGPAHVEGDVEMEITTDTLPYFLHAARMTVVKTGGAPDFVYTYEPAATAQEANKTMSITIVRNGVVLLSGFVPDHGEAQAAIEIALEVDEVEDVINGMDLEPEG